MIGKRSRGASRHERRQAAATRPHIAPDADAEFEASERRWQKGFQEPRVVGLVAPPGQQARGVAETQAMRLNSPLTKSSLDEVGMV